MKTENFEVEKTIRYLILPRKDFCIDHKNPDQYLRCECGVYAHNFSNLHISSKK